MKTSIKLLAVSAFIASSIMSSAQLSAERYSDNLPILENADRPTSEKIIKEIDKIVKLSDELNTADAKREKVIKRKIASRQEKIAFLKDDLRSDQAVSKTNNPSFLLNKYEFDVADKTLEINKFIVQRNGTTADFNLQFETDAIGEARVDIISPAGELIKSIFVSNFDGKLDKDINLSCVQGMIYIVHIDVDGKGVTRKVRFN